MILFRLLEVYDYTNLVWIVTLAKDLEHICTIYVAEVKFFCGISVSDQLFII